MVVAHLRPWCGVGIRHIPVDSAFGVLDFRLAGRVGDNRWNAAGDPTLYLASDTAVALAEFARHLRQRQDEALAPFVIERAIYRLDIYLQAVLDLRESAVQAALGLRGGTKRFLDIQVARATASFVRRTTPAQALLVPSMAFLDDPERWNLVIFLDRLPQDLSTVISATAAGTVRVGR